MTHVRRSRPPSARSLRDETLKAEISRVHKNQLPRCWEPARCTRYGAALRAPSVTVPVTWPGAPPVRLMGDLGLRGVRRARSPRTTRSASREQCPVALVRRHFEAFAPGGLWVADIPPQAGGIPSYVRTFSGWVYVAFVTDVYSRRIIGWQTTYRPVCTDLAAGALKMAVWQRKRQGTDLTGLVHHLRPRGAVQVHPLRAGPVRLRGSRLGGVEGRLLSASPWPRL